MTRTMTREELSGRLGEPGAPIVIEALPVRYFDDGHIPGALHLPHDEVDARAATMLPDRKAEIVVYCASASCRNSHLAAISLKKLGYDNVAVYAGGKQDWAEAGLPLVKSTVNA